MDTVEGVILKEVVEEPSNGTEYDNYQGVHKKTYDIEQW